MSFITDTHITTNTSKFCTEIDRIKMKKIDVRE
jgi:hypothetical protein